MPIENVMILTDEDLVLMAQEGSKTAVEWILKKYSETVEIKAAAYYLAGGETEDLFQEGSIGLYNAIMNYKQYREAGFKTYASKCIDNQIIKAIAKANREKNQPLNGAKSLEDKVGKGSTGEKENGRPAYKDVLKAPMSYEPEEAVIYEDLVKRLKEFSDTSFSDLEKEVLKRKIQGKSYQEIAKELGKPSKTIDNALQRIRKKIADFLEM